jgi:hypothetical protein
MAAGPALLLAALHAAMHAMPAIALAAMMDDGRRRDPSAHAGWACE